MEGGGGGPSLAPFWRTAEPSLRDHALLFGQERRCALAYSSRLLRGADHAQLAILYILRGKRRAKLDDSEHLLGAR